jgi:hypothetical protein
MEKATLTGQESGDGRSLQFVVVVVVFRFGERQVEQAHNLSFCGAAVR